MTDCNYAFRLYHLAGRQHKITTNDLLVVNTLEAETGAQIFLNKVCHAFLLAYYGHVLVRKWNKFFGCCLLACMSWCLCVLFYCTVLSPSLSLPSHILPLPRCVEYYVTYFYTHAVALMHTQRSHTQWCGNSRSCQTLYDFLLNRPINQYEARTNHPTSYDLSVMSNSHFYEI